MRGILSFPTHLTLDPLLHNNRIIYYMTLNIIITNFLDFFFRLRSLFNPSLRYIKRDISSLIFVLMRLRVYEGFTLCQQHNLDLNMNGCVSWVFSVYFHDKNSEETTDQLVFILYYDHVFKYENPFAWNSGMQFKGFDELVLKRLLTVWQAFIHQCCVKFINMSKTFSISNK